MCPLPSSLPGLVLDLALGSSGISLFGMNGGGLAQEPVGILPGCVHLTLVRIQQPQVGLSLQPLLPVNASEVNHKEKKKKVAKTLWKVVCWASMSETVLIHFPLCSYLTRKKKKN